MARADNPPTVVLFDVDGTLVVTGGAGRRAMRKAFEDLHGGTSCLETMSFRGMTDGAILGRALEHLGKEASPEAIDAIIEIYLGVLADEVARAEGYRVMPGVEDLLRQISSRETLAVGLGTGNVKAAAEIKIARGGLSPHFAFGGFGCDAVDRAALLDAGFRRGAARLGLEPGACRRVVVGDTPRDVDAAMRCGAIAIGVGTGGHPPSELLELGAVAAFADLSQPAAIEAILEG